MKTTIEQDTYVEIKKQCRQQLTSRIDYTRDQTDEDILDMIDEEVLAISRQHRMSLGEMTRLKRELFASIRQMDVLEDFISDSTVTEIMINGPDTIFVERGGKIELQNVQFESIEKLSDVIQQIVSRVNRVVNEASPIVDARLPNGDRVNVVLPPIALNGPILTIRRFPAKPIMKEDLFRFGSITPEIMDFISQLVTARYNVFISGGTGSGKTTFLNVLSNEIPSDERVITVEDNAELQILNIPNLVKLETRNANIEGCKPITIRDLIKSALRMRPDRIVVGEIRSGEAIDLLSAMNTGHDGSLSTGHANSAKDMLSRLETMALMGMDLPLDAIRRQIASAIDIIVHLGRLRDHSRKVLEIVEIIGFEDGEVVTAPLYQFVETGEVDGGDGRTRIVGELRKVGRLQHVEKLQSAGIAYEG